ncbi:MAG: hypothetical protein KDI07_22840 [Anaerolineae bacterium]|nr:hypothetical protein [Anaerolineae bacterium]
MIYNIDDALDAAFTPQRIIRAYFEYKVAKWDQFSGFQVPRINIPMGTDGIEYEGFEKQLQRHAQNIADRIHTNRYVFHPIREFDTKKDIGLPLTPDNTRTLGIASIRDALVQSILYKDVLYEPLESLFASLDKPTPVSFGYRKGKSAPVAAQYVFKYAMSGYWHVYDADLSKYFDTIPHDRLLSKLALVIGGSASRTYSLVRRFVSTDRTRQCSYQYATSRGKRVGYKVFHWKKPVRARPKFKEGVPQGGVLSGMLANLYLHDFDDWIVNEIGKGIDLRFVRYADDFIIMVKDPELLTVIGRAVKLKLESGDFVLRINADKTREVDIRKDGLEFVGFSFDERHMRIRKKKIEEFKSRLTREIFQAIPDEVKLQESPRLTMNWLVARINSKVEGLRGHETCPWCGFKRISASRSWMAFFRVVTDDNQLRELDKWIRKTIYDYMFAEFGIRVDRSELKNQSTRLRSLVREKRQVILSRTRPCLCDIEEANQDIWIFAPALFQGRSFKTLAQNRLFAVPHVDEHGLQVSVGRRQHRVEKDVFQKLWNDLVGGQSVTRVDLERNGIRNTSHIVALMAELPAIKVTVYPITLTYIEKRPAQFLTLEAD